MFFVRRMSIWYLTSENFTCSLHVFLISLLSYCISLMGNDSKIWNDEFKIWQDTVMAYFKVLSQHFPGETGENHRSLWCLNPWSPEYKARLLTTVSQYLVLSCLLHYKITRHTLSESSVPFFTQWHSRNETLYLQCIHIYYVDDIHFVLVKCMENVTAFAGWHASNLSDHISQYIP